MFRHIITVFLNSNVTVECSVDLGCSSVGWLSSGSSRLDINNQEQAIMIL